MSGVCAVPEFWTTISEALTVIDGVFDATAAGGIVFHAAAGLDAPAVAAVQACVRRRFSRSAFPLTGKWVLARYVAERHVIAERYAEFEIIGPPEIRDVDPDACHFNPAGREGRRDRAAVSNVSAIIAVAWPTVGESRRVVVAAIAV